MDVGFINHGRRLVGIIIGPNGYIYVIKYVDRLIKAWDWMFDTLESRMLGMLPGKGGNG